MKRRAFAVCLVLLIGLAGAAWAQENIQYFNTSGRTETSFTYGGSGREWLSGIAVAADGRIAITGYTESTDGTLSDRTKSGRSGWVMMLDADMQVQWNFCSRHGTHDHMKLPVFHEDGTLSVLLYTEGQSIERIRLDADGGVIERKMLLEESDEKNHSIGPRAVTDNGYLLMESYNYGSESHYLLYDFEGGESRVLDGVDNLGAAGERHVIAEIEEDEFWLCAYDAQGQVTKLAKVYERVGGKVEQTYETLISLPDGGAVACGRLVKPDVEKFADYDGIISRWDAAGNIIFEMILPSGQLQEMVVLEDGFAATHLAEAENIDGVWELMTFGEDGILRGKHVLRETNSMGGGCPVAVLADGSIVCAQLIGEFGSEDVRVTVIAE